MGRESTSFTTTAAEAVFGEGYDRVCHDIPESACREQPANLGIHLASLTATKTGDGLVDPKLVLAWLVGALGGSAAAIGLLVPVREAFALVPQLAIGHYVRRLPRRKLVWALASIAQGLAVGGIAVVALTLTGARAAWAIVGLVLLFAIARSFASVSYKDVLGKTVSKRRRGTVTGTAASVAATAILLFGVGLWTGAIPLTTTAIAVGLIAAAVLWLVAGLLFTRLTEEPGATDGGVDGVAAVVGNLALLWRDPQLGLFVLTRSLLTVTAIAPPYLLAVTADETTGLGSLGPFVVASSLAAIIGGRLWGRLSDRSSRRVLMGAAASSAVMFCVAGVLLLASPPALTATWSAAALLFLIVLAYQGVRLGRSTHLVDMAAPDQRALYSAVSNTAVGAALLATGAFGLLQQALGLEWVFLSFALFSLTALLTARALREVQQV